MRIRTVSPDVGSSALSRHHAAPLLTMATMIRCDIDTASEIIAAACRPTRHPHPASGPTRIDLAHSVYRPCIRRLAMLERFGAPLPGPWTLNDRRTPNRIRSSDSRIPVRHRAVLALMAFGGHDLHQTSLTLRTTTSQGLLHLGQAISAVRSEPLGKTRS